MEYLRLHELKHGAYECRGCDTRFLNAEMLVLHGLEMHHGIEPFHELSYSRLFDGLINPIVSCVHGLCEFSLES